MVLSNVLIAAISIIVPTIVVIYLLVLLTRFVKAVEKIAENTSAGK